MKKTYYDVIIIGAGIVGGAIARELSKYRLSVLCLEREADVCCGISKANTGIIHSPALITPGTLKAEMSVNGAESFRVLSEELGFVYQQTGALVLAFNPAAAESLANYSASGSANYIAAGARVPQYRILNRDEIIEIEPEINRDIKAAFLAPDAGRIIPYEYGIALWENALCNSAELKLNTVVKTVERVPGPGKSWKISTSNGTCHAGFVVNAAGHGANDIGIQAGFKDAGLRKVKGQYLILERDSGPIVNKILFQVPDLNNAGKGKGILVTRTVYGNLMIGPDARFQETDTDTSTDIESLVHIVNEARLSVPSLDPSTCIKTFAGIRPKPAGGDFIIDKKDGFIHLCGIESPGITASPAIALRVMEMLKEEGLITDPKNGFKMQRKPIVKNILALPGAELKERIALPTGYEGRIVCRCEQVPENRIIDALGREIPVTTIDGIKRRTRAGQGRCQGSFCKSRVAEIVSSRYGLAESALTQRGGQAVNTQVSAADIRKYFKDR